ncbi:hypothetical protein MPS_1422 [Mycobacterium pseudoshottsii JCM 15466]|uniref:Uncharacterized protein n=1 Tax=Mycobacterium ulcerans str. Harvey TaxID=1299332 RepID=A0ABP3AD56_MYCUL|nr:hypothetical protein I551_4680 [Mycobacterium ulcerans str. Harvey]GAQ33042.1 hypothetical protein MPS_1422 [Mycobacterium pseudoshottsii JCM 15466]
MSADRIDHKFLHAMDYSAFEIPKLGHVPDCAADRTAPLAPSAALG